MCKVVEEYAREYAKEYAKELEWTNLIRLVCKKLSKGKSIPIIADELEESEDMIRRIVTIATQYEPNYDIDAICKELLSADNEPKVNLH